MDRRPAAERTAPREWWWIFDPRLSLRASAALITVTGAALFTALTIGVATTRVQQQLERQLGRSFETLAFQLSDKLDRRLHDRFRELQFVATLAALRADDIPPAERRRVLETMRAASGDFAWIGFVDTTGRVAVATDRWLEGANVGTRPWFRAARTQPYAGLPRAIPELTEQIREPGEEDVTRFIDLAVPVSGERGEDKGVLAAHVRCGAWMREVLVSVIPEAARRERLGATVYAADGDVLLDSGGSGWTLPPAPPALPDRRRSRGHMTEPTEGGTTYLTGFVRGVGYGDFRGFGSLVTVRQPLDDALAPVRTLQRTLLLAGIAACVAVALAAWLIAGRFSRRLHTIRRAAERIREGDILTVMPSPRGRGELAQMTGALGDMVTELRKNPARADNSVARE